MTLDALAATCQGQVQVPAPPDATVTAGYTSDMLSDVMANAPEDAVLITIQNHLNTIAVCTLVGIKAIVICHNRPIPDDMRQTAEKEGIGLVSSPLSQFAASCAIGRAIADS